MPEIKCPKCGEVFTVDESGYAAIVSQIKDAEFHKELAVTTALSEKKDEIVEKEKQILLLETKLQDAEKDKLLQEQSLKEKYAFQLKEKDDQIAYFKDLKTKMSTKMVGETLEQHCEIEFNKLRSTGFQNAYFEKDNDAKTGSRPFLVRFRFELMCGWRDNKPSQSLSGCSV